jgi:hypothetical protein
MYDDVYATFGMANVAIKLDKPQWIDRDNNIVANEEEAFGRKSDILVTRPDMIIMVDECGDNTSQKQDGTKGGQKKITPTNGRARQRPGFKDFTTANGEPVMSSIIIYAQSPLKPIEWEKIKISSSMVQTKSSHVGQSVLTNAKFSAYMLRNIDSYKVFNGDRANGTPCLAS